MVKRQVPLRTLQAGSEIRLRFLVVAGRLFLQLPVEEPRKQELVDHRSILRLLHRCILGCSSRWVV